ncbi:glycosyltransferase family 2 protein [Reichenbachiella agarivorans]|uniref:Glycosyltransferase family 2 protein n=1 Tax=Reichenbachiella agarivorans TaxID=2979464 RepID=A0ABY6CR11_9BACT|nr:glycosyltransferase family A protein [Reichenbachiella agarivorans]UXP32945.1 glycosyltransferase family 2 protein [Reichenbachiella agarivorans]
MPELVSIIMPVYNAEKYVAEAIESVLAQSHTNWELLVINDGSTDRSAEIIQRYDDPRIHFVTQANQGVSAARNVGLKLMTGDYFCFLDGDDRMTTEGLSSRLAVFEGEPALSFVDGAVTYFDQYGIIKNKGYVPTFHGLVFDRLLRLDNSCFFGNTWMIKRTELVYQFDTDMTHSEDLWFYIQLAKGKSYHCTNQVILEYRQSNTSAMKNLQGLEKGYRDVIKKTRMMNLASGSQIFYLRSRICRIMFLSYLFDGKKLASALVCPFRIFTA